MLLGFSVYILSYDRSGWGTTQTCFLAKRVDNEKEDNFRYWNTPTELNYGQEASSGFLTFLMILRWQDAQTSFKDARQKRHLALRAIIPPRNRLLYKISCSSSYRWFTDLTSLDPCCSPLKLTYSRRACPNLLKKSPKLCLPKQPTNCQTMER